MHPFENMQSVAWIAVLILIVFAVVLIVSSEHAKEKNKEGKIGSNIPTPPAPPNPRQKTYQEIILSILKSKNTSVNTKLREIINHQRNTMFTARHYCPAVIREIPGFVEIPIDDESKFGGYLTIASEEELGDTPAGIIFRAMGDANPFINPHLVAVHGKQSRYVLVFTGWVNDGVDGEYEYTVSVSIFTIHEPSMHRLVRGMYAPVMGEPPASQIANIANEAYINSITKGFNEHVLEKARHEKRQVELGELIERSAKTSLEKSRHMRSSKQRSRLPLNSQNRTLKFRGQKLL